MARWVSYIDNSVGDGANTIAGIISNGPTYGIGISSDVYITGLSTFGNTSRFTNTVRLDGQLRDGDNAFGSSGQVLSSDGTDTRWINAGELSAGAASQVAVNDDSNTNAERFITFVDTASGNNNIKTDASLKYNPSTNTVRLVGGSIQSQNASGTRITLLDTDGSLEIIRESGPFIDFKTSVSEDHDCRIQMENDGLTFTTGGNGSASPRIKLDTNGHLLPITDSAFDIGSNTARFSNIYADDFTGNLTGNTSGSSGSCTGNAATATILANTRTIGGVSFNGSADINLPGVNQAGNQNTSGNAATATVLETTRNFSISGEITANAQSFNGSGNVILSATVDDNIIDEANLKISNSPTNGRFLQCNTGVSGGLTWADVTLPSSNTLSGTTLSSGITASSITSLGTLSGLTVNGTLQVDNGNTIQLDTASGGLRGYIQATETNDAHLIIATSGGEDIAFKDGGTGGTTNMVIRGDGNVIVNSGTLTATNFSGNGSSVTSINASNISSGELNASRLPNHSAALLTSGTIPDARLDDSSLFVTGMIIMYQGNTAPSGWALCDGQSGRPDLRDKFVIGSGNSYALNATGGSKDATLVSHSHTVDNHTHSFSSSHTHSFSGSTNNPGNHAHSHSRLNPNTDDTYNGVPIGNSGDAGSNFGTYTTGNAGSHTHSFSGNTGAGTASGTTGGSTPGTNSQGSSATNANLPPYYALAFIIKL